MRSGFLAVALAVAGALGCGGGGAATTGREATCEANCDRAVAAGCAQTAANYGTTCKMLCVTSRSTFPQCQKQMDALSACVADEITYTCQEGTPVPVPGGICQGAALACLQCTGNLVGCSG